MGEERDPLQDELDELFADLCQVSRFTGIRHGFRPRVDSFLTGDPPLLTVVVELPGLDPERIALVVEERVLHVAGERLRPAPGSGRLYQQMELDYGAFQRRIQLPHPVDVDGSSARYADGLLTIELPLAPQRPRNERTSIPVKGLST